MKLWKLLFLIVAIILVTVLVTVWLFGGFNSTQVSVPTVVIPAVAEKPVVEEPKMMPQTINHFDELRGFYIDGDPHVVGFKVKGGGIMSYTCETGFGVFISMDPGEINGFTTGKYGAVGFVNCKKGEKVTLLTAFWNENQEHYSIHLVEMTQEITAEKALEFLKVLKVDEGKELALFIDGDKVTKY